MKATGVDCAQDCGTIADCPCKGLLPRPLIAALHKPDWWWTKMEKAQCAVGLN